MIHDTNLDRREESFEDRYSEIATHTKKAQRKKKREKFKKGTRIRNNDAKKKKGIRDWGWV